MTTPLMDSKEVAALLKCSERTAEDYARSGRLPAVKFGESWVFPVEALLRAVNRMAEDEAARRAAPSIPAAVKQAAAPKRPGRPNLSVLSQAG